MGRPSTWVDRGSSWESRAGESMSIPRCARSPKARSRGTRNSRGTIVWSDSQVPFFFFQAEDGIRDADVTGGSDVCSSDLGCADLVDYTTLPDAVTQARNTSGQRIVSDGRTAVVRLRPCGPSPVAVP